MKAVVYCRVSTKEQTKNLSLPAQRKACRQYCDDNGWKVDRVFVERGESAKTAERTELNNLLAYCRENRGRVQMMVVYSLDRFARNNY
ncbi:MAG: recombinase family protein, partial [Rhodothermales bacterium]|nr:recombinase family protein [Rhodothermales bacterium]